MKKIITYESEDGKTFESPHDCAMHEIKSILGFLEKVDMVFSGQYPEFQLRWCGGEPTENRYSGACACMGCVNHAAYEAGLTYYHWKIWLDEYRQPHILDGSDRDTRYAIVMKNVGTNIMSTLSLLREYVETFDMQQVANVLKQHKSSSGITADNPVKISVPDDYHGCEFLLKKLKKSDAKFEIARL